VLLPPSAWDQGAVSFEGRRPFKLGKPPHCCLTQSLSRQYLHNASPPHSHGQSAPPSEQPIVSGPGSVHADARHRARRHRRWNGQPSSGRSDRLIRVTTPSHARFSAGDRPGRGNGSPRRRRGSDLKARLLDWPLGGIASGGMPTRRRRRKRSKREKNWAICYGPAGCRSDMRFPGAAC
jgi:hypothetical protein